MTSHDHQIPYLPPRVGAERGMGLFSHRLLFAAIALCGLVLSVWTLGGEVGVRMAVVVGIAFGLPITFLGKRKLLILGSAVAGALVGAILALHFLGIDVERFHDTNAKHGYQDRFLFWSVVAGTLLGPVFGMVRSWLWHLVRSPGQAVVVGAEAQRRRRHP